MTTTPATASPIIIQSSPAEGAGLPVEAAPVVAPVACVDVTNWVSYVSAAPVPMSAAYTLSKVVSIY